MTVKETVKKQAFQLIKISEDGEQTETELVEGAGFKVFLISELSGVKDGSLKPGNGSYYTPEDFITYDYSKDETASYWENGKRLRYQSCLRIRRIFKESRTSLWNLCGV